MRGIALACQKQCVGLVAMLGHQADKALGHNAGDAFAQANVGHQFAARAVAGKAQQFVPEGLGCFVRRWQFFETFCAQCLRQQLFTEAF